MSNRGFDRFSRFGNAILISLLVGFFALYAAFGLRGVAVGLGVFGILNAVRLLGRWTR